jgi:hypothetical protein
MPSSPVLEPTPPSDVVDAAHDALQGWFMKWLPRSRELFLPLHVFVVELGSLVEPVTLTDVARPAGWRFQSAPRSRTGWASRFKEPIAVEVGERPLDVRIERGPGIDGVKRAMREAKEAQQTGGSVFEPRMLRVPEAHLAAVWFRDVQDGNDAVVPLAPAPDEFESFRRYAVADFLETVSSLARRKLEMYAAHRGEKGELGA